MTKTNRIQVALAVSILLAGAAGYAQSSGEALYKAKCQMCHGAKGMAESAAGRAMKVKPVTNPEVKNMSEADMILAMNKGMGKMQSYKDSLSVAQIKEVVTYFRGFLK
jgi:mono/diheme cytochrome c family protein